MRVPFMSLLLAEVGFQLGGGGCAVRGLEPVQETGPGEVVLLGADRLDDVRREHAADLRRTFQSETPRDSGQEAGTKRVTDTRWVRTALFRRHGYGYLLRADL